MVSSLAVEECVDEMAKAFAVEAEKFDARSSSVDLRAIVTEVKHETWHVMAHVRLLSK